MRKQAPLQFKPKKLTLQLLPRTDALYQSICQLGFNPGIQVKFKETKTAAFVVDYLKQRWQPIIKQFNVREVRIFPKKVSFACITHRGWGLSDINVQMASVRKEVLSYQIEQGSSGVHADDDVFHMEYDFVFCDDKPALPFVVSQLTPTSLFEFAPPPPKINPVSSLSNSIVNGSMVPPPSMKKTSATTTTPAQQSKPKTSTSMAVAIPQPLTVVPHVQQPALTHANSNNRPTNSFITSFAQVSHVLDSMRNVQNSTQSLPNTTATSQMLIPSLSSTLNNIGSSIILHPSIETKDSKKRKNQASPSKKKKTTTQSNKKKKSSKDGEHHMAQQTIDSFIKLEKEPINPQTPLQPTENSGLSQLFHADFSMSLPLSQSTNNEKKRDSSAYSNLELSNFTELFGSTTPTTTSCKEQSNAIFLDNSHLNLLQSESNGSSFLGPKDKSLTRENTNVSSSLLGGTSLQSFASLFA